MGLRPTINPSRIFGSPVWILRECIKKVGNHPFLGAREGKISGFPLKSYDLGMRFWGWDVSIPSILRGIFGRGLDFSGPMYQQMFQVLT